MWLQCHAMHAIARTLAHFTEETAQKQAPKSCIRPRLSTTPSASVGVRACVRLCIVCSSSNVLGCVCHTGV